MLWGGLLLAGRALFTVADRWQSPWGRAACYFGPVLVLGALILAALLGALLGPLVNLVGYGLLSTLAGWAVGVAGRRDWPSCRSRWRRPTRTGRDHR